MRPLTAMYVGGMGSSTHNYHREAMARRGFPEAAARIQELWLAGRKDEARAAVPDDYLEQTALGRIGGPHPAALGARLRSLEATGVTGMIVSTDNPKRSSCSPTSPGPETGWRDEHVSYEFHPRGHTRGQGGADHPEPTGEAQRHIDAAADRAARRPAGPRPGPRCGGDDHSGRRRLLLVRLRPVGGPLMDGAPFYSAPGDGQWARQANDTWFSIWDLAKPVIAQIHGYAIAGGTELASACDLVYVAADAAISYPVVRVMSPPDWQYHTVLLGMRRAMELMLTGDPISGVEAAQIGFANRAFEADVLEAVGAADRGGSPACRAT